MGSVNKVILVGNLGRDAELRYTPGGAPVATLNMATTEIWNDKGGQRQEKTEWHRVVLWGKTAESLSEYLTKGKQIYVEGKLQTRQWDDKDGNKRYTTEVRGDRVVLLGGGGGGGGGRRQQRAAGPAGMDEPMGEPASGAHRRRYPVLAKSARGPTNLAPAPILVLDPHERLLRQGGFVRLWVVLDHRLERLAAQARTASSPHTTSPSL